MTTRDFINDSEPGWDGRELLGTFKTVLRGSRQALRQLREIPVGHQARVFGIIVVYRVTQDQYTTVPPGEHDACPISGVSLAVECQQLLQSEMSGVDDGIFGLRGGAK